ncbi:MAG TPA: ABC transporter substrate-binding protein [Methylomirabilota bacterium]|jgi:peptide/nickel transport system substrate-binding protein|nr:ABC transporter substrate-binding protein [Methylomirabilota bacterium]
MSDARTAYLDKLPTVNISRRGFIRVATGVGLGVASGPLLIRRAGAQSKQPLMILYGVPRATMDPQNHINTYDESPLGNMFENLVDMSNPIDPYKGWKPMLAVSWKRVNETTFQFKLREKVKFHNGEDFDAEAVKFSIDRLLGRVDKNFLPPTVAWHAYDTIDRGEPVDRYTVNVITKVPDPIVLNRFNGFGMRMVSPKFYSENPTAYLQNHANGTGPYRFVSWVKDGDLVMEANQQYWGGAPAFEKVIIRTVPEASTRVSALMSGQADVTVAVPAEQADIINRSGRGRVEHVTSNRFGWWRMNAHVPPTNNVKVRQAFNYAANVGELLRTIYSGLGERLSTIVGKYHFGYDPTLPFYPHDPDKARKLLKESGLPLPITVNFHFIQGRYTKDKDMGEGIIGELNKLGPEYLRVVPKLYEAGTFYSQANAGKLDGIIFNSWGNWMFDADIDFGPLWRTKSTPSPDYPNDPALDKLVDEARSTIDEQKRKAIYSQLQKMMWESSFAIFGMQVVDMYGVSSRVNWKPRPDEMIWAKEMKPRSA